MTTVTSVRRFSLKRRFQSYPIRAPIHGLIGARLRALEFQRLFRFKKIASIFLWHILCNAGTTAHSGQVDPSLKRLNQYSRMYGSYRRSNSFVSVTKRGPISILREKRSFDSWFWMEKSVSKLFSASLNEALLVTFEICSTQISS